ncbi:laminin subunit alpha-4 isoform X1 [Tupaia chinensis]|uniref:laminin subunit alpha-4 isoform X1 n=1 Tax=Tupaia chinensis TaxID=246437 RepID=UPI0003C8CFBC|nr:laminin subunit alpha-4 isoform X1 [Tupaia chinensis]XP_014446537.1 laminin subunit alpha-4 isoform X1 [Tupaia chinensis]
MTLGAAWSAVLPLWLLWGAACSSAASGDGNAFPFDIEGSSAVGRQDPPEMSEPRVAPGPLPPVAEVPCPCHCHPVGAPAPRGVCHIAPPPSLPLSFSPYCLESFTWRPDQKLEIKSHVFKLDSDVES